MIPELPELPMATESGSLQKFIFKNGDGEIFATKNFDDTCPIWRKYRRPGWALRYLEGNQWRRLLTNPRTIEFYEHTK